MCRKKDLRPVREKEEHPGMNTLPEVTGTNADGIPKARKRGTGTPDRIMEKSKRSDSSRRKNK